MNKHHTPIAASAGSIRAALVPAILSICFAFALPSAACAESWVDSSAADAALSSVVAKYNIPDLAVAVVDRTGIAYSKGFGESRGGEPVTGDTPFYLGSTSKTITALAVLDLVRAGKIGFDEPISTYLSELPSWANAMTVRHLLNHTSGLTGRGMDRVARGERTLTEEARALSKCVPQSASGSTYAYFNGNYRLLGAIVERVSGLSFGEYVKRSVFDPLGMTHSRADGASAGGSGADGSGADGAFTRGIARGHGMLFGLPIPREQEVRAGAVPSGYVVSSVSDFSRLLVDELRVFSGEPCVLDRASVAESWTPPEGKSYAMGWMLADESIGGPFLFHGGSLENYMSFVMLDPASGKGFVMMMGQGGLLATTGGFSAARNALLAIVKGTPPAPEPSLVPVWSVTAVVLALVALELFLSARVKRWALATRDKGRLAMAASLALEALPIVVLAVLVPVANAITGDPGDWQFLAGYLPESALLALVIVATGVFRIVCKVFYYYVRSIS